MSGINSTIAGLELAQIDWVVPDINAAVAGEWLTTQTYNGGTFIELAQPHRDHGHHARRMDGHRTNAEGPVTICRSTV